MRTITDHLTDIIQNSIKANAKNIKVEFIEDYFNFVVKFSVEDESNSIDMPDIGNLVDMYISILNLSDDVDFFIKRVYNKESCIIDTKELKKILGVSLSETLIYNETVELFKKKERSIKQNA